MSITCVSAITPQRFHPAERMQCVTHLLESWELLGPNHGGSLLRDVPGGLFLNIVNILPASTSKTKEWAQPSRVPAHPLAELTFFRHLPQGYGR